MHAVIEQRQWYERFRTLFRFVVLFAGPLLVIGAFYSAIAVTLVCRSRDALDASAASVDAAGTRQLHSRRKVGKSPQRLTLETSDFVHGSAMRSLRLVIFDE